MSGEANHSGGIAEFKAISGLDALESDADLAAMFALNFHHDDWRNQVSVMNLGGIMLGGHIAALGVKAAYLSAGNAVPVSAHVLFLSGPDPHRPCDLKIQTIRDGQRLAHRETSISQNGRLCARVTTMLVRPTLSSSGPAYHHMVLSPAVPDPQTLPTRQTLLNTLPDKAGNLRRKILLGHPFLDIREIPCDRGQVGRGQFWVKVPGAEMLAPVDHLCLLTLISDFWFSLPIHHLPGATATLGPDFITTSLDHAIWYHAQPDCSDWILFDMSAMAAGGGLATLQAQVWSRDGQLLANIVQNALFLTGENMS